MLARRILCLYGIPTVICDELGIPVILLHLLLSVRGSLVDRQFASIMSQSLYQLREVLLKTYLAARLVLMLLVADIFCLGTLQAAGVEAEQKWRIVNYWSEWCVPCRREIPVLNELEDQLTSSNANVTVVGVDFDEYPRDEALEIANRMGIEFPTLTIEMVRQLNMPAPNVLPTTYILSPDNQVVARLIGEQTRSSLLAKLADLELAELSD